MSNNENNDQQQRECTFAIQRARLVADAAVMAHQGPRQSCPRDVCGTGIVRGVLRRGDRDVRL